MPRQKYNSDTIEIGNNIRKFRVKSGLSQEKFAEQLDISNMTVSRLENGSNSMSMITFLKILAVLEVSAADLLPGAYSKGETVDDSTIDTLVAKLINMNKPQQNVVIQTMSTLISTLESSA